VQLLAGREPANRKRHDTVSEELASANTWRKIISWGTVIKQRMILYIDK
jgi:hypothetical protein